MRLAAKPTPLTGVDLGGRSSTSFAPNAKMLPCEGEIGAVSMRVAAFPPVVG
jgi:hypothetical protein